MKKITIFALVLVSLFLSGGSFAQELSDWEQNVYCDYLDTFYSTKGDYNALMAKIAIRHGISVDQLEDIEDKALDKKITDWEWKVAEELTARLNNLPKGSSWAVRKEIFKEIAAKYKLSLCQLYDIDNRCMAYWLW